MVCQALLEVPGRTSQEPETAEGVGLPIFGQGLAAAPLCSEYPTWGRPSLNLQGEPTPPPSLWEGNDPPADLLAKESNLGAQNRGGRARKGYLLSGSSWAWNLEKERVVTSPRRVWQLPGPAPAHVRVAADTCQALRLDDNGRSGQQWTVLESAPTPGHRGSLPGTRLGSGCGTTGNHLSPSH